jgi:gliding motility-associated-like protein
MTGSNTISVLVNALPVVGLSGTATICSGASLSISSTVSIGTAPFVYQWAGPNSFSSSSANITIPNVTIAAGGNYQLTLTDANGCIISQQTTVMVNQSPALTFQTVADTICNANALSIQMNSSVANTNFYWSASLIAGTAVGFTNNLSGTHVGMINDMITNTGNTPASVMYQVTATTPAGCSVIGSKSAIILPVLVNQIDTATKTICAGQAVTITSQAAAGGNGSYQYLWEKSLDGTNWVLLAGSNNTTLTFIPDTMMQIRRTINSYNCTSSSLITNIVVQPALSNNSIVGNQQICAGVIAQVITGSVPTGGNGVYQYQWQMSVDSGATWLLINGETNKDINPGIPSVSTWYQRVISSGFCAVAQSPISNKVLVDVKLLPKASIQVLKNIGCSPFLVDSTIVSAVNYQQRNSNYNWYLNNSFVGNGLHFPGTTLSNDSAVIKLTANSGFGCGTDSMETIIRIYPSPKPAFNLSDSTGCGILSVQVMNTTLNTGNFQYLWDFGNGQQSQQAQPGTIQYSASTNGNDTTYLITLKAYQYCDTVSFSKNIIVSRKAKSNFTSKLINTCSPLKAEFYNYSTGKDVKYLLSFGDGLDTTISASGSYAHTYHTGSSSQFLARLLATNGCGTDSTTIPIAVLPNPVKADLKMADTAVCGYPYTLTINNNTLAASSFTWDFGNGSAVETSTTPGIAKHLYQQPGSYLIKNIITSYCSDSVVNRHINIYSSLKALSNRIVENNCIGTAIRFDNLSDAGLSAQWQLGDGTLSDSAHFTHVYSQAGNYTVGLKVWLTHTDIACADSTSQTFTIVGVRKGQFTPSDTLGKCIPFVLSFENKQNHGTETNWNWGDGSVSKGDTVTHSFNANGNYTVSMASVQSGGCLYVDTALITVKAPEMSVSYKGGSYCKLNSVVEFVPTTQFTDSIRWNFGDGTVITTIPGKTVHNYSTAGSYLPKVTLLNATQCAVQVSMKDSIQVDEIQPGFKITVVNECANTNYGLKDTSASYFAITRRTWSIGTAQPATANVAALGTAREIVQSYTKAGNYEASLNVENQIGCQAYSHAKYNVLVYEYPKANINAISQACLYNLMEIRSTINSQDPLLGRYWNLGNGSIATDSVVSVTYSNAGNYTVKLTVATVNSCYDSASKQLSIHPLPQLTLAPEKNVCQGDSLELKAEGAMGYIWKDQYDSVICNNCGSLKMLPQKNMAYKVVGFNEFGCTNIASTNVHIVTPFKLTLKTADSLCIGSTKKINVNGAATYTWLPTPGLSSYDGASIYATPASTTTYQVIGKDAFHCFADTAAIKLVVGRPTPIHIGNDTTVISGTPIKLNTTNPAPDIVQWKWGGKADYSCVYCASPEVKVIMDEPLYCTATNQFGCITTDTIQVKTFCSGSEVFIPNAFTPDGDGINDVLIVQGRGIKIIKSLRIFSRWGEVVFEKTNFVPGDRSAGWDGKIRGKQGNTDVYIYLCEAVCERGTPFVFKGNVAIIK